MKKLINLKAEQRAALATVFFAVAGLLGCYYQVSDWRVSLPLFLFYITIVINTYFSVLLFASITPKEMKTQHFLDILLFFSYLGIAGSLGKPLLFVFFDLTLFIIAITKYTFLLNEIGQPKLLKRKILVDLSGTFAALLALAGILLHYEMFSVWALCILFIIANFYLFFIKPLYKLD